MTPSQPRAEIPPTSGPVTVVHACLRDGTGGSPTVVLADDEGLDDETRRGIPALYGASHAVFLGAGAVGDETTVRFFTAGGELPACGHGTVAALAHLAEQEAASHYRTTLRTVDGRPLQGWASRQGRLLHAEFEAGPVALREPTSAELSRLLPALGLPLVAAARVATLGRPRLLIQVPSRAVLAALAPDLPALDEACRGLDLLGCYAYAAPAASTGFAGHYAARMFAPAIGVPEDIANANSTACLAAHLQATADGPDTGQAVALAVDMGDSLESPATITARLVPGTSSSSPLVRVGGTARVDGAPRPV